MGVEFEWDDTKAESNLRKHGVSFDEAVTVFGSIATLTIYDAGHSGSEDRFMDIGPSVTGRILVVVYTERGDRIRIIGCRKATHAERRQYEQGQL